MDFAVGVSVFLLVVSFVFVFAPGFFTPFTDAPSEETVVANRVADKLASDLLGSPNRTHVLEDDCTAAFFDGGASSPPRCRFTGTTVVERTNVSDRHSLNVTLSGNLTGPDGSKVLCYDDDTEALSEAGCSSGEVRLSIGSSPGNQPTVVSARRVVTLKGTNATLEVDVW